jgi:hypothetical protein
MRARVVGALIQPTRGMATIISGIRNASLPMLFLLVIERAGNSFASAQSRAV